MEISLFAERPPVGDRWVRTEAYGMGKSPGLRRQNYWERFAELLNIIRKLDTLQRYGSIKVDVVYTTQIEESPGRAG